MASAIRPRPTVPNAGTRRQVELSTLRLLWTSCRQTRSNPVLSGLPLGTNRRSIGVWYGPPLSDVSTPRTLILSIEYAMLRSRFD
jgi:hypothetical protein